MHTTIHMQFSLSALSHLAETNCRTQSQRLFKKIKSNIFPELSAIPLFRLLTIAADYCADCRQL